MRKLDYKESWAPKNWSFWTVVLEKILESPLDCKEIQPVHPKGNQSWVLFIGRTDAEAETPILWPPHAMSWLIGKDLDDGMDWGQEEKGTTEDEMAGWHHRLDGHEFGWTLGVGDGQGGLACCDSWVAKSWTWLSDWTELNWSFLVVKNLPANAGDLRDVGFVSGSEDLLEKETATHSRILAWRIPCIEEPGRLQSIGLHKVGHYWSNLARCTHKTILVNLFWIFYYTSLTFLSL